MMHSSNTKRRSDKTLEIHVTGIGVPIVLLLMIIGFINIANWVKAKIVKSK